MYATTLMRLYSKEHMIVEYDVTNNASDNNSLSPIAKSAKETL